MSSSIEPPTLGVAQSPARIVSVTTGDFSVASHLTHRGKTLADVMAYRNPHVVARLAKEEDMSIEEAESALSDALLFLWLGNRVKEPLAPALKIDLAWHAFLLFTKDYREFCTEYFGGFIDHHPRRLTDEPDGGRVVARSWQHAETVLIGELGLSLSRNWIYERLQRSAECCGNCGQGCCSR